MGPSHAAEIFARRNPNAKAFEVTLYGSLAATGKGHLTDVAINEVLSKIAPVEIIWLPGTVLPFHTNGMCYKALDAEKHVENEWVVYSVGGGALSEGKGKDDMFYTTPVYELSTLKGGAKPTDAVSGNMWTNARERKYGTICTKCGLQCAML